MAVLIENPADCEVQGVISFPQTNEILGYLVEEAGSHVELFCCTTMHIHILPGRHEPCCMSNSIGTSLSILPTVRIWNRRTYAVIKNGVPCWLTLRKWWRTKECCRWPHGMKRVNTNWCQGTSALMSKATMWNIRQRYVPKLVYSVSVLLLKSILGWRNVLYFLNGLRK